MLSEDKYFRDLTEAELWQRYCGFLDLSIDEFMDIQEELLLDQIERVAESPLGKKIMSNQKPKSVEEFRRMVPLTTYEDYEPYLSEQQESALAIKPYYWCHSAGRGGYFKWLPYGSDYLAKLIERTLSGFILALANQKGEVNLSPGVHFLSIVPPPPYASGSAFQALAQRFSLQAIPPLETTTNMEFQERVQMGFQIGLKDGVDLITAIASVLVGMGEAFSGEARGMKFSRSLLHPKIILRLLRAWLRSKREKRTILPKDLWPVKGILTGGVDTAIYKDAITRYWGREPYEFYGCAEAPALALQGWNKKGMTFPPDLVFLEFIPYQEQLEHQDDKDYHPSTVLLAEVEEGKSYEVVITQFYGMPLLRYRLNDIVKVTALKDGEAGVSLPQIIFQHRADEVINLSGLAWLDEKVIWQAIANSRVKFVDWSACKGYEDDQSFLRLFLELKEERKATELETIIDEQLKILDVDYRDIETYLTLQPVRVTLLSPGTFQRYMDKKRREGADLAHIKPAHINAPEAVIQRLLEFSEALR